MKFQLLRHFRMFLKLTINDCCMCSPIMLVTAMLIAVAKKLGLLNKHGRGGATLQVRTTKNALLTQSGSWWMCPYNVRFILMVIGLHHLDSWIKIDQLDVTCFIISLFTAQHVSNVSISILRSLRLIVDLFHVLYCSGSICVGVTVWFGWGGVVSLCRLKH